MLFKHYRVQYGLLTYLLLWRLDEGIPGGLSSINYIRDSHAKGRDQVCYSDD